MLRVKSDTDVEVVGYGFWETELCLTVAVGLSLHEWQSSCRVLKQKLSRHRSLAQRMPILAVCDANGDVLSEANVAEQKSPNEGSHNLILPTFRYCWRKQANITSASTLLV